MSLFPYLSDGPYYVRIWRDSFRIRNLKTGSELQDEAIVSINVDYASGRKLKTVEAVGTSARNGLGEKHYPFQHPRVIVGDYVVAETLMRYAFRKVKGPWYLAMPIVIVQCMIDIDGGVTSIEERALRDIAAGAGGRKVYLWTGRELTDAEIVQHQYLGQSNHAL